MKLPWGKYIYSRLGRHLTEASVNNQKYHKKKKKNEKDDVNDDAK